MKREHFGLKFNINSGAFIICCIAFVFYVLIAKEFPVVYWYDSHIRLALRDQILLGHWLPLIQILIVVVSKISTSMFVLRILLALIAGGALVSTYFFARHLFSKQAALIAVLFLATNMMFVALATVPYPEILFICLLFIALNLLDETSSGPHFYAGIVALNLACLTRYEGWLLAGIFIGESFSRSIQTKGWGRFLRATLVSSVAPLGWLIFGISNSGNLTDRLKSIIAFEIMTDTENVGVHFLSHLNPDYLKAFASNYFHLLNWQAGVWIILLGALGWWYAFQDGEHRAIHWRILGFIILDWLLLALFEPWDFTNLRTAFIGQVFLILYSAYGLQKSIYFITHPFRSYAQIVNIKIWVTTFVVLVLVYNSITAAITFVKTTSQQSDFFEPAQVGDWLKSNSPKDGVILSLTDDIFQPYALATYSGLAYNDVLDDRFDSQQINVQLAFAQVVYVVESYRKQEGLSSREISLLHKLNNQTIKAQLFTVGNVRMWRISKNEIELLKVIYN